MSLIPQGMPVDNQIVSSIQMESLTGKESSGHIGHIHCWTLAWHAMIEGNITWAILSFGIDRIPCNCSWLLRCASRHQCTGPFWMATLMIRPLIPGSYIPYYASLILPNISICRQDNGNHLTSTSWVWETWSDHGLHSGLTVSPQHWSAEGDMVRSWSSLRSCSLTTALVCWGRPGHIAVASWAYCTQQFDHRSGL